MKIERFEDIVAWQKARILTKEIHGISMAGAFREDFGLRGQIQRAAISTMSNIAEGFERGGNREFAQFLSQSKGSCGELRSDLYVALDQGYVTPLRFEELYERAVEVSRLVSGLRDHVQRSAFKGTKYNSSSWRFHLTLNLEP